MLLCSELTAQVDPNRIAQPRAARLAKFDHLLGAWEMAGEYSGVHFAGRTTIARIVKGWVVEWVNEVKSGPIDRELRVQILWDSAAHRYRVSRQETTHPGPYSDEGQAWFRADTLVVQWPNYGQEGVPFWSQTKLYVSADTLFMASLVVNANGMERPIGVLRGARTRRPPN